MWGQAREALAAQGAAYFPSPAATSGLCLVRLLPDHGDQTAPPSPSALLQGPWSCAPCRSLEAERGAPGHAGAGAGAAAGAALTLGRHVVCIHFRVAQLLRLVLLRLVFLLRLTLRLVAVEKWSAGKGDCRVLEAWKWLARRDQLERRWRAEQT